jgi:hypothetical protein
VSGDRAGDHDSPTVAVFEQRGQRRLYREVHPLEHHVDRVDEGGDLLALVAADRQDARIGEDEVDTAEFCHAVGHGRLQPLEITHVALFGHDAAAGLLDEVDGLVEVFGRGQRIGHAVDLVAQIERDDVGALFSESDRV